MHFVALYKTNYVVYNMFCCLFNMFEFNSQKKPFKDIHVFSGVLICDDMSQTVFECL